MPYFINYIYAKFKKLMRVLAKDAQIALVAKKVLGNITFGLGTSLEK